VLLILRFVPAIGSHSYGKGEADIIGAGCRAALVVAIRLN
jgi:hypothetical protein